MKKCIVLYNPNSGSGFSKRLFKKLEEKLKKQFIVTIIQSEYRGHIEKIMTRLSKVDVVFTIGGDGTFNEAMSGNAKRDCPLLLGHLPVGTTNDVGHMFGMTKNILHDLDLLLNGCVRWVDTCYVNDKLFTYAAGIGKFMAVSYETPQRLKKKIGYAAYLVEGLKDLLTEKLYPYAVTYEINGQTYKDCCSFILISNSNRIAGTKFLARNVKLNDRKIEVLVCTIDNKNELIKQIMRLPSIKDISKIPGIKVYQTERIKLFFDDNNKKTWTVDGEPYSEQTAIFDIYVDKTLPLLLPKKNVDKLFLSDKIWYK